MAKRLKFEDIDEWTPSSISIVDEPSHPLCKFEVYEDDEEYVKKSIEIKENGEIMVENPQIEESEQMVSGPASFFRELLNRTVAKSEEEPEDPKAPEENDLSAKIKSLEERIAKLEEAQKVPEPAPGAVAKSEGEATEGEGEAAEGAEETEEENEETTEEVIDEEEVVSKSIDPDLVDTSTTTDKSLVERAGRKTNGMTW